MRAFRWMIWMLVLLPWGALAFEIVAISPSTAPPGARVSLTGGPFDGEVRVQLGEQSLRPLSLTERQLIFVVPELPAGDYRLTLQWQERTVVGPFMLRVIEPQPVILALDPLRVDLCSAAAERRITVEGEGFAPGARLLVDGAQLPAEYLSAGRMEFTLPGLAAGMHRLEIVNPNGSRSLPNAVLIDGVPEILSVAPGEDRVVSYDLVISGRNFPADADLLVDGIPVNASLSSTGKRGGGRDRLLFVDCQTLVYTRYPLDREPGPLSLTVVVPGIELSAPFHITAP